MSPQGPFRLMTVNTAPERAKRVIGAMVENLKESYIIDYVVNSESMSFPRFYLVNKSPISQKHLAKRKRTNYVGLRGRRRRIFSQGASS